MDFKTAHQNLIDALENKDKKAASDSIDYLEDNGKDKPAELVPFVKTFGELIQSKDNRIVWGSMYCLRYIASVDAKLVKPYLEKVSNLLVEGSVISQDNAAWIIGYLANDDLLKSFLRHIEVSRPKDAIAHTDYFLQASNGYHASEVIAELEKRSSEFNPSQLKRFEKIKKAIK